MAYRIQLIVASALLVAACGLDVVGVAPSLDGSAPVSSGDAAAPTADAAGPGVDANECAATCPATAANDATFKTVVLYGEATAVCPASFDSADVVEDPVAKPTACGCGTCTVTASCNGDLSVHNSNSAGCGNPDGTFDANNGACMKLFNTAWGHNFEEFTPAAATNVKGSAPTTQNPSEVDRAQKRICTARAGTCTGASCAAPSGFKSCLEADGEESSCPAGFPDRHTVGDDIVLTCGDCTAANATATCTGTLNWWSTSSSCAGTPNAIPANTCGEVDSSDLASYQWVGAIATQSCTATPGTPNVTLKGVKTICCP